MFKSLLMHKKKNLAACLSRNRINVNSRSDVMNGFSKHRHYTFVGQKSDDHAPSFWFHHKPLFMFRKYNSLFMFKRHKYSATKASRNW